MAKDYGLSRFVPPDVRHQKFGSREKDGGGEMDVMAVRSRPANPNNVGMILAGGRNDTSIINPSEVH